MKFNRQDIGKTTGPVNSDVGRYRLFAKAVKETTRFIFDKPTREFVDLVRERHPKRLKTITKDIKLWRSLPTHAWTAIEVCPGEVIHKPAPYAPNDMVPKIEHTMDGGRANPPGIAFLYLATRPETALAESRPALSQPVTLGLFAPTRELSVVVCDYWPGDSAVLLSSPETSGENQVSDELWKDIGEAFSIPIVGQDPISYIPTQIIAEIFRSTGADGVAYRSRLGEGTNLALFDTSLAQLKEQFLYSASKISYEFAAEHTYGIYLKGEKRLTCVSKLETSGF